MQSWDSPQLLAGRGEVVQRDLGAGNSLSCDGRAGEGGELFPGMWDRCSPARSSQDATANAN